VRASARTSQFAARSATSSFCKVASTAARAERSAVVESPDASAIRALARAWRSIASRSPGSFSPKNFGLVTKPLST
jgi:hypothetical protein